jgi:hypothetical protein
MARRCVPHVGRAGYGPRLEPLEPRLPPGDVLLGKLMAASWTADAGAGRLISAAVVSPTTPVRWAGATNPPAPVSLAQHPPAEQSPSQRGLIPAIPGTSPLGGEDLSELLAALDPVSALDGSPITALPKRFVHPALAIPVPALDGGAAAVAAPSAPAAVAGPSLPAATPASSSQPVNDPNYVVAGPQILPVQNGPQGPGDAPPPSGSIHALFQLDTTQGGPFPADRFTVADRVQNTGRRVNLPSPDCTVYVSDCADTAVLNTLDGFNLQPRLSVPFDGPIDVGSVTSQSLFLISLGDTLNDHDLGGQVVGINQVVWDTFTNTLHVESDQLLDQHTRYALLVTDGLQDTNGHPVQATTEFRHFRQDLLLSHDPVLRFYGVELEAAVLAAQRAGVPERDLVDASVFTTESATAVLEKLRDQVHAATPAPADFNLGPNGDRTVFSRADVTSIHWEQQTGDDPPSFTPTDLDLSPLDVIPGAVGQIAFGRYVSPDYEVHPGEYIPPIGTRTGTPAAQGDNEIYFNLVLPSGPKPEGGWPVALFGHGNTANQYVGFNVAASMAAHGIATLSINAVGHGFGPLGTLMVNQTSGAAVTFLSGGRGRDQNGDHVISANEGIAAAPPRTIISRRDGALQTAVDLMQLVREIQVGMDVEGDGTADLDPAHIYFVSHSFGGSFGAPFLAVEPSVGAGVLNAVGGGWVDKAGRLSPSQRPGVGSSLAARVPPLLDSPGIAVLDGVPITGTHFHENLPLRDGLPLPVVFDDGASANIQSPVVNTVSGAMAIQEELENQQWATQAGNPLAYAAHLRKEPLRGVPAKSVIIQFAKGDMTANNPMTTAIVRAGDLADRATYYRNDLAYADDPNVPKNPHSFMLSVTSPDDVVRAVALGAQEQIATFFASDGTTIIQPEPAQYFETPIQGPLPEDLNFIP